MKTKYFNVGDKVQGNYFETPFVGTVIDRRFHTIDNDTVIYTIEFPEALDIVVYKGQPHQNFQPRCLIDCYHDGTPHDNYHTINLAD